MNYINLKLNLITERYKFKEHKQAANKSVIQFNTGLKKFLEPCEFRVVLNNAIRDQII